MVQGCPRTKMEYYILENNVLPHNFLSSLYFCGLISQSLNNDYHNPSRIVGRNITFHSARSEIGASPDGEFIASHTWCRRTSTATPSSQVHIRRFSRKCMKMTIPCTSILNIHSNIWNLEEYEWEMPNAEDCARTLWRLLLSGISETSMKVSPDQVRKLLPSSLIGSVHPRMTSKLDMIF